jgi:hypothetical protein
MVNGWKLLRFHLQKYQRRLCRHVRCRHDIMIEVDFRDRALDLELWEVPQRAGKLQDILADRKDSGPRSTNESERRANVVARGIFIGAITAIVVASLRRLSGEMARELEDCDGTIFKVEFPDLGLKIPW